MIPTKDQSIEGIASDTSLSLGQGGAEYINNTNTITGNFGCVTALEDSVISGMDVSNWSGDAAEDIPLKAGVTIFGNITSITLTSGKVIAYKNP